MSRWIASCSGSQAVKFGRTFPGLAALASDPAPNFSWRAGIFRSSNIACIILGTLCFWLTSSSPVRAATFIVTSALDAVDGNPGDGVCETIPGSGICTLRAAIMEANRAMPPSVIYLTTVPGGVVTLSLAANGSDDEATGDLNILADMMIVGAGPAATTIDASGTITHDRAFRVQGGSIAILGVTIHGGQTTSLGELTGLSGGAVYVQSGALILSNCVIQKSAAGDLGGGLYVESGTVLVTGSTLVANAADAGGGIAYVGGGLTIEQSTISGNAARFGGGVYHNAPANTVLFVVNSTVAGNVASGRPQFIPEGYGGGFYVGGAGAVTLQNATISGNVAGNSGGGISSPAPGAPIRVFSSTITANVAVPSNHGGSGGGVSASPGRFNFQNTILAGNSSECAGGTIVSNGFNLITRALTCTVIGPVTVLDYGADLGLGPLQDNGGPTPTHALLVANPTTHVPQSPAIDQGDPTGCHDANGDVLTVDQRGVARPFGATCDIGAYELNVCTYAFAGAELFVGINGAAVTLPLTVNDTRCSWSVTNSASWILVTAGDSGSGSGTIHYTVLPNPGGGRSGTLTAGGQTFLVRQASHEALRGDFEGDRKAEVAIYRPSKGMWFMLRSATAFTEGAGYSWGADQDVPVPGDYDGDGRIDITVYRPSTGHWFVLKSSTGFTQWDTYQWGVSEDIPVPGDYDGDGATDVAFYRPSEGRWYILLSAKHFTQGVVYEWGNPGDLPLPGDYDGDGRTDLSVYKPVTPEEGAGAENWRILLSSSDFTLSQSWRVDIGFVPVPGDYDGDGRTDPSVYDPETGSWFGHGFPPNATGPIWGAPGDVPVPADYDGDGRTDVAVYRPTTGHWFILKSSTGFTTWDTFQWGNWGDVPITR